MREMVDAGNPGGSVPENVKMSVTLHWHPCCMVGIIWSVNESGRSLCP